MIRTARMDANLSQEENEGLRRKIHALENPIFQSQINAFINKVRIPNNLPIKLKKRMDWNPHTYIIEVGMTNETVGMVMVEKVCVSIDSVSFHTSVGNYNDPPRYGKQVCYSSKQNIT